MNESLAHVVGPAITVCGRVIQRCAVCGFKLADSEGTFVVATRKGVPPDFPTWQSGRLVRVTEGTPTHFELLPDSEVYPDDGCITLVE